MKKQTTFVLLVVLVISLSCQSLAGTGKGTVISDCSDLVSAMYSLQAVDVPDYLLETGRKQGGEFDVNAYFDILPNLSMEDGYMLDYVYPIADLGASPVLYVRPAGQLPYLSM